MNQAANLFALVRPCRGRLMVRGDVEIMKVIKFRAETSLPSMQQVVRYRRLSVAYQVTVSMQIKAAVEITAWIAQLFGTMCHEVLEGIVSGLRQIRVLRSVP